MSNSTREAQELLRLFKCVVDTGTDVLAAFAKVKLLPTFNGNFKQFLDDKKHEIFHLWQSKKLSCCECPPAGYNIKHKSHMDNWIFKKIYDDSGPEEKRHIVRNSGNVVQVCLHKYVTRNIAIDELDISVISFLLRTLAVLTQNETTSLGIITTTRSQICHAYSMNCYPMTLLNTAWTELENALVDLADPSYKRIIRKQIKFLRKVDLEKEEITELKKNVEELNIVLHEVFDMQKVNNGIIKNGFTTCENQILKAKKEIIQNTDKKLAEMTEEIQQLKATISILIEQNPRRNESPNTDKYEHIESSNEARSEEVYAQQGAKPKRKPEDIRYIRTTCHVEGEELDEHSAVQLLPENKRSFPPDLCFNIITAEKKCLLLELKATSKILQDIESFRMALRALIIQIALAAKIDINKPSTITLKLIFKDDLTEDDMNVMKQISGRSFTSRIIEGSLTYPPVRKDNKEDNCKNCEYLKKEVIHQLESTNRALILSVFELELLCSWHVRERSKLAFENRQLELGSSKHRIAINKLESRKRDLEIANHQLESLCKPLDDVDDKLLIQNMMLKDEIDDMVKDNAALKKLLIGHRVVQGWLEDSPLYSGPGRGTVETPPPVIGRRTEEMPLFVNRRRTVPTHRLANRRRNVSMPGRANRRRNVSMPGRDSPGDSGSESMSEAEFEYI